ncbi:hypothetical protein 2 [Wenling tombus-like virus 1]|uniref:hypothetical protein 2 n=1 Tax=Wenling tombus-like virus 1 TaxID=1923543 RepID=UPI00090CC494|nr:hypothetical protein 2 [Wenling tombus-like virus 1]APG76584.1 hypothetical protein 2 [Wenling tombus-like virus 1]
MWNSIPGCYNPFVHSNCVRNEYVAMRDRVVGKVPVPTERGVRLLRRYARKLVKRLGKTDEISYDQVIDHYHGRKRKRYEAAKESLGRLALTKNDSIIKAFVKCEKFNPADKVNPAPRMIQARNARYNLSIARWLRPIEHAIYRLKSKLTGLPIVGKGRSLNERAELLAKKFNYFKNPVVYSLDASRWDQHCDIKLLEVEHWIYRAMNGSSEFATLLQQQLYNKCFTEHGIAYKTKGKRMSGDVNTALGNCLLAILLAYVVLVDFLKLKETEFELLDDGDDLLVIVEQKDEHRLEGIKEAYLEVGHEIKLENRATVLEDVEWCQHRPVHTPNGWRFVPNWKKVLSSTTCDSKHWMHENLRPSLGHTMGKCLLSMYTGIPVLQEYCQFLIQQGNKDAKCLKDHYLMDRAYTNGGATTDTTPVDPETRLSFQRAFGMTVQEQLDIETRIRGLTLPTTTLRITASEVLPGWKWEYYPGTEAGLG